MFHNHLNRDAEAYKFLFSKTYKYGIEFGKFTNIVASIVGNILTGYVVYKKYITSKPNVLNNYTADWKNLKSKLNIHENVHGRSGDLPVKSTPMSSKDLYVNGKLWQRIYYDSSGKCIKDINYYHTGVDIHSFPHEHYWDWSTGKLKRI